MDEFTRRLIEALKLAQHHLEYCGWGDPWERECALADGLPETIQGVLDEAENTGQSGDRQA